jgi:Holliday junction resolvase-like predicted endonuclease
MKPTEEALASRLMAWLTVQGWDCYPEVQVRGVNGRVDLVATRGPILHAIEVKTSASLAVLAQAMSHRGKFHCVSVATPWTGRLWPFQEICASYGIGCLVISTELDADRPERWRWHGPVRVVAAPRLDRGAHQSAKRIRARLSPEHKRFAPGNATCSYWTPFRATCDEVLRIVSSVRAIPLRELVSTINHHYASDATARSCLRKWIEGGKVPGVEAVRDGPRVLVRRIVTEAAVVGGGSQD